MTKTQLADHVLRLANRAAVAEIRRLKARLRADRDKGQELFARYGMGGIDPKVYVEIPHEIEDFLQSVGSTP